MLQPTQGTVPAVPETPKADPDELVTRAEAGAEIMERVALWGRLARSFYEDGDLDASNRYRDKVFAGEQLAKTFGVDVGW
jgi:hypothetical protein